MVIKYQFKKEFKDDSDEFWRSIASCQFGNSDLDWKYFATEQPSVKPI